MFLVARVFERIEKTNNTRVFERIEKTNNTRISTSIVTTRVSSRQSGLHVHHRGTATTADCG